MKRNLPRQVSEKHLSWRCLKGAGHVYHCILQQEKTTWFTFWRNKKRSHSTLGWVRGFIIAMRCSMSSRVMPMTYKIATMSYHDQGKNLLRGSSIDLLTCYQCNKRCDSTRRFKQWCVCGVSRLFLEPQKMYNESLFYKNYAELSWADLQLFQMMIDDRLHKRKTAVDYRLASLPQMVRRKICRSVWYLTIQHKINHKTLGDFMKCWPWKCRGTHAEMEYT